MAGLLAEGGHAIGELWRRAASSTARCTTPAMRESAPCTLGAQTIFEKYAMPDRFSVSALQPPTPEELEGLSSRLRRMLSPREAALGGSSRSNSSGGAGVSSDARGAEKKPGEEKEGGPYRLEAERRVSGSLASGSGFPGSSGSSGSAGPGRQKPRPSRSRPPW